MVMSRKPSPCCRDLTVSSFLPDYIDCEIGSVEGEEAGEETSSGIYEGDDRSGTLKQEIVLVDECGERGEAAAEPDREEELDFRG